nr:EAL domain-containing protein [Thermus thermophilus]
MAVEVLVRWVRGEEVVPAGRFIPLAEEAGLVPELDLYVLRFLAQLQPKGGLPLHEGLFPALEALRGREVRLELTEHAFTGHRAEEVFLALHDLGFPLVLDDFGQGYASLSLLVRLPFAMVKVDLASAGPRPRRPSGRPWASAGRSGSPWWRKGWKRRNSGPGSAPWATPWARGTFGAGPSPWSESYTLDNVKLRGRG